MAKKGFLLGMLAMVLTFGLALTGCPIEEHDDGTNAAVPDGFGTVRVSLGVSMGAARTAMPSTPTLSDFARVEYWFAKGEAAAAQKTPDNNDVFTMEEGNYTLTVKAYVATTDESPAAEGASSSFAVAVGTPANVTVTMRPIVSEGNGSLSFSISYPADATVETFTLTQLAGDNPITLTGTPTTVSGTTTRTGSNVTVVSGYYSLQITLTKADFTSAGAREVVHIYQNLSTAFSYTFTDAEFRMPPVAITSVAALTAYLATLPTGSAATPTITEPLAFAFNTGTVQAGQIAWADINTAVQNSGKYVTLDLSACTAANDTTANTIVGGYTIPHGNNFNIIMDNTYIKGVVLPVSLTSIGSSAFVQCSGLTLVTIPSGVTRIEWGAFWRCSGLTSVTIPDTVTFIGDEVFSWSGLTSVTIPGSVTYIGSMGVFRFCSDLTAFIVEESNTTFSAQDGILYNKAKTTLISVPGAKSGALNNLPNTLTTIRRDAFSGCSSLTSVFIPDSVTTIADYAFLGCSGLTSVTIPDGLTSIGHSVFMDCSGLTAFIVRESNGSYSAQDGILYNKAKTTLISVPEGKSGALNNLPNTLTTIEDYAFWYSSVTSVTIPSGVTSIGDKPFWYSSVTSVTIPSGVTSIGDKPFWYSSVTSVTIPGSVTTIGYPAFYRCDNLTSVIFGAGSNIPTEWSSGTFPGTNLWAAYIAGNKAGTYTRDGVIWTQMGGEGSVTLTFWVNEDNQILASNDSVTISKTSAGYASSFTATVSSEYSNVSWSVSGVSKPGNESIEIAAADYPTGTYRLGVSVRKDGVPYSTEITFTVIN